jgi:beta-lactamase class A
MPVALETAPSPTATLRPILLGTPTPSREETLATLQGEIESLIAAGPSGTWGVVVKELRSGETVGVRQDEVFHPASTIKVGIAMDLLYWMERHPEVKWTNGPQANQRSFAQLLEAMLVKSEETATVRLAAFLDSQPGYHLVDRWQAWGVTHTTFIPRRTTPSDLARLLEMLYKEEALTHESSTRILEIMRIPKASRNERIGAGLPAQVRANLANKSGTTFENLAGVVADTGIVVTGNKVLIIVVVGNRTGSADYEESMQLISEIARAAFVSFVGWPEPVWPSSPHGEIP